MALDLIYTFVSSPGCSKEKKRNIIYCKTPNSASHNFCFFIVEASLSLCACFLIPPSLLPHHISLISVGCPCVYIGVQCVWLKRTIVWSKESLSWYRQEGDYLPSTSYRGVMKPCFFVSCCSCIFFHIGYNWIDRCWLTRCFVKFWGSLTNIAPWWFCTAIFSMQYLKSSATLIHFTPYRIWN